MLSDSNNVIKEENNPEQFQWGGVLLISVCHLIHDMYSSFLSPLLWWEDFQEIKKGSG